MAGNTWAKRQRETAKRERKEAKRARRDSKRGEQRRPDNPDVVNPRTEDELMTAFATLNREHAAGAIDEATFKAQRNELWVEMGLPVD